jgi:inosine-uridine nucleoside N-ribohydrolase
MMCRYASGLVRVSFSLSCLSLNISLIGGFAGQQVVPEQHILKKFKGLDTCASANFGNSKTVSTLLTSPKIRERVLISKNVCHGVVYNKTMHTYVDAIQNKTKALELLWKGMGIYLQKNSDGKKFHDPLACAVIFNHDICTFKEVEMYHHRKKKGWEEWGYVVKKGTNTWISVSVDKQTFLETLTKTKL